jgi:hypothetical protein
VREYASRLPDDNGQRLLAEIVLGEADGRLPHISATSRLLRSAPSALIRSQSSLVYEAAL